MAETAARFVGQPVKRREDPRILTGRGKYVDDVVLPGMLFGAFVRSPYAKAEILSIETRAARAAEGVHGVFVVEDLRRVGAPGLPPEADGLFDVPLADGFVACVGDPVALVVAESRALAEDASELVEIDYTPLQAVVTIEQAMADGAALVRPGLGSNVAATVPAVSDAELDEVFRVADHVITKTVVQNRYIACPMETRGVVAEWRPYPPRMTVWISTQGPHQAREHFARLLGLPANAVRVIVEDVGGAFGLKIQVGREESAIALAARLVGRPVKWIEDRWENLVSAPHAREEHATVSMALSAQGTILGVRLEHAENVGAGPARPLGMVTRMITGPYRIALAGGSSTSVRTNTSRRAAYRGPWLFETLARETMIDIAARQLGIDPLELRRQNVLSSEDLPYVMPSGMIVEDVTPRETLEQAVSILDYEGFRAMQAAERRAGRFLGVGLAAYVEPSAFPMGVGSTESCTIRIDPTGTVQAITGANSQGHSVETTMAQVIADQLGIDYDAVVIVRGDTDAVPVGNLTGGSRNAVFGGGAARMASATMRDRLVHIAAEMMEANPDDLEIERGVISVRGTPVRSVTIADVAGLAYLQPQRLPAGLPPGLECTERFTTDRVTWSNATHACTCEVDPTTGKVLLLRYIVSEDCGVMINPKVVEGQICGGVVQGIGGVLLENFIYDRDGNPQTSTFMDYLLPTASDVPGIEYGHIVTTSRHAGGWKGMGEGGAIGAPAAVVNAVADALSPFGAEVTGHLSPAAIVEALVAAEAESTMKAAPFEYRAVESLAEAAESLRQLGDEARVLAGGQSLIPLMSLRLARPGWLVDINALDELATIEVDGSVVVGALVRQRVGEESAEIRQHAPLLGEALGYVAHPAIRNRGTIGGSIAHADPAAELPTVLCALEGEVLAESADGRRTIAAEDFFIGAFTTALRADEVLVAVRLPRLASGGGWCYREFSRRHGDFALVGVAASLVASDPIGGISAVRLALSGVGSSPVRCRRAEAAVEGQSPSGDLWIAAAEEAAAEIDPGSDLQGSAAYRRRVTAALVAEALRCAHERATNPSSKQ